MPIEGQYNDVIGILKDTENACKEAVGLMKKALCRIGDIDDYTARLVAGEVFHLVTLWEGLTYDKLRFGSIPYMISLLEERVRDLPKE